MITKQEWCEKIKGEGGNFQSLMVKQTVTSRDFLVFWFFVSGEVSEQRYYTVMRRIEECTDLEVVKS